MIYYSRKSRDGKKFEPAACHVKRTAELARVYGGEIGSAETAEQCAMFHDLGKYSDRFQRLLRNELTHINHAAAGAYILRLKGMETASRVVFAHHGHLEYSVKAQLDESMKGPETRDNEQKQFAIYKMEDLKKAYDTMLGETSLKLPKLRGAPKFGENGANGEMLYNRLLLSCLADADYSSAAEFEEPDYLKNTDGEPLEPEMPLKKLRSDREAIKKDSKDNSELNALRDEVFERCLEAAALQPGIFTLTAPTGLGKTLAMLAFALRHAAEHGKRRIFVVLPYLSIIEQNTKVYRSVCPGLIEDHSQNNLAERDKHWAERWTAPVIVTTSVKFFESFFRCSASDCRRLHSIADSVILFDEVQTLPYHLTDATLSSMKELTERYGCTVLFSSATQPDFDSRPNISWLPTEIIKDAQRLYDKTRRVNMLWRISETERLPAKKIAEEMKKKNNVCAVLNTKKQAAELYAELLKTVGEAKKDGCFYITADLCPSHRIEKINAVKDRQKAGLPCLVVATSCIEAGVDLDFDFMYRTLAPLQSIIQSAGRVNRGGRLKEGGTVVVYRPETDEYPKDIAYKNAALATVLLYAKHPEGIDINNLNIIKEYYKILFTDKNTCRDDDKLINAIKGQDYSTVEERYKLIDDAGCDVIVPYAGRIELYNEIRSEAEKSGITPALMKKAAPITVHMYDTQKAKDVFIALPFAKTGGYSNWFISPAENKQYDPEKGLIPDMNSIL